MLVFQELAHVLSVLSDIPFWALFSFFSISFLIGIISALFGIGGGFFFTPFFHSVLGLPPVQAVATSMLQIPFMSASGSVTYLKQKRVEVKIAFWLLLGAIPSSQITAWFFSYFSLKKNYSPSAHTPMDIFLVIVYTFVIGGLGLYTFFKKSKADKNTEEKIEEDKNINYDSKIFLHKKTILVTGLAFGFIASALGVGGGFLVVPYFIYVLQMPTSKATATSLFTMFFLSLITSVQFIWYGHAFISLAGLAALGTMSGAQVGSRIAIRLPSTTLKKSFALIQLLVVSVYLFRELPKFF